VRVVGDAVDLGAPNSEVLRKKPHEIIRVSDVNVAKDMGDSLFQFRYERSNRPAAANRAEETMGGFAVAKWNAALQKTGKAMVRNARV
jgi:hypothetical protein